MTKIDQKQLEAHITNGGKHSYASLRSDFKADAKQSMQIDRTLQKLRRKGKIGFTRAGRTVLWQAVTPLAPANVSGGVMSLKPGTVPGDLVPSGGKSRLD